MNPHEATYYHLPPDSPTAQAHADAGPTIRIPLVGGRSALIDADDDAVVSGYRWRCLSTPTGRFYAYTNVGDATIYMHRLIAGTPDGMVTDHANNDGLDNRRANLRPATWTQNVANVGKQRTRAGQPTTSRYKGVSWDKARGKWAASAKIDGRYTYLGRYDSESDAARAYDVAALGAWGEFAALNFPDQADAPSPYKPGRKKPPPRTHCPKSHEYTAENTYTNRRGYRLCKTCIKKSDADRWAAGKTTKQRYVATAAGRAWAEDVAA